LVSDTVEACAHENIKPVCDDCGEEWQSVQLYARKTVTTPVGAAGVVCLIGTIALVGVLAIPELGIIFSASLNGLVGYAAGTTLGRAILRRDRGWIVVGAVGLGTVFLSVFLRFVTLQ
jgi:hypothetical protein